MRLPPILLALLLLPALSRAQDRAIRVALSRGGRAQAWIHPGEGLSVIRSGAAPSRIPLGSGAFPRFTEDGRLIFERSRDDGHHILDSWMMVLDPDSSVPRPALPGEPLPSYRLPPLPLGDASAVRVCIDPGHGGSDPGAIGFGLQEKDITLDIALRLHHLLVLDTWSTRGGGTWDVLMTRSSDIYVGLSERANLANAFGAQSFLSIHVNSFSSASANGTETYCYLGQSQNTGGMLRNSIHEEAIHAWGLRNRGVKEANFAVLRLTAMPAALAETGFITSPIDIVKLQDPFARRDMALGYLFALQLHHGFPMFDPRPTGGLLGPAH